MGRWGNSIIKTDGALDYFSTITDRIEREFAFQFSPEQITAEYWWVVRVIKVVEITLLLYQYSEYNILYDSTVTSVQRWRKAFFIIWDGNWKSDQNPPFDDPNYRKEKRSTVMLMFSQLEDMAQSWADQSSENIDFDTLLSPYSADSISRSKTQENFEYVLMDRFTRDLIEQLVKDIIYWLSPEKRDDLLFFFRAFEDPIVAADLLACICEAYRTTPLVNQKVIQNWRTTYFGVIKQAYSDNKQNLDETDPRFKAIIAIFDKLELLAQQYPPDETYTFR